MKKSASLPGASRIRNLKSLEQRSATLKKKARELVDLCGAEVCLVAYDASSSKVKVWPEDPDKAKAIIDKYRRAVARNKGKLIRSPEVNISTDLEKKIKEHDEQKAALNGDDLDKLPRDAMTDFTRFLESKVENLDRSIRSGQVTYVAADNNLAERFTNYNYLAPPNEVHQSSIPRGFNNACSASNAVPMGFGGQNMFSIFAETWASQNYCGDISNNFQNGLGNCSYYNTLTAQVGADRIVSAAGTSTNDSSSASCAQWGPIQQQPGNSGFGTSNNFASMGFGNGVKSMAALNKAADNNNFGVMEQNEVMYNNLLSSYQKGMARTIPQPSPLDQAWANSFWSQPLQVEMN